MICLPNGYEAASLSDSPWRKLLDDALISFRPARAADMIAINARPVSKQVSLAHLFVVVANAADSEQRVSPLALDSAPANR